MSQNIVLSHIDTKSNMEEKTHDVENECHHVERRAESSLTAKQIRRLRIRIDIRVLGFISLICAISIIDRINIGSAKVLGMQEDLGMNDGARYSVCLLLFFPGYILSELPSNILLVKLGVKKWISITTFFFGTCVLGIGFAPNWGVIAFLRFFVGVFECGIVPGAVYLISSWYPRYELHRRLTIFYGVATVGSAFAGLLAFGIGQMGGIRGYLGWRWIFILEGILTMALGAIAPFFLSDFPDRATFLNDEERDWVLSRLEEHGPTETEQLTVKGFLKDSMDPWIFVVSLMYLCVIIPTYGLAYFIPTILTGLGHLGIYSSLYSAPPYCAGIGMLIITGVVGDKLHIRGPIIIFLAAMTIAGLSLVQPNFNDNTRYGGLFLAVMGSIANAMTVLAFGQNNIIGSTKRSTMTIWNLAGSSIGGIIGSTIFRSQDAPTYGPGLYTTMAIQVLLLVVTVCSMMVFYIKNYKADRAGRDIHGIKDWRYTL